MPHFTHTDRALVRLSYPTLRELGERLENDERHARLAAESQDRAGKPERAATSRALAASYDADLGEVHSAIAGIETPAPQSDIGHPAPRAVHAVNNVLQILIGMAEPDRENAQSLRMDASAARRLLEPVLEDVAAMQQHAEALEARIADLLETGMASALYIQRLEDKNTALNEQLIAANQRLAIAHQELEHLYVSTSVDMERHTTRFNTVVRLRSLLDLSHTNEAPRAAAAGSR